MDYPGRVMGAISSINGFARDELGNRADVENGNLTIAELCGTKPLRVLHNSVECMNLENDFQPTNPERFATLKTQMSAQIAEYEGMCKQLVYGIRFNRTQILRTTDEMLKMFPN
jgi:hypothetical protein